MKLTELEEAGLSRLEDPDMSKADGELGSGSCCCCLGHFATVCGHEFDAGGAGLISVYGKFDYNKFRLRDSQGTINSENITDEGWELLYTYRTDVSETMERFKYVVFGSSSFCLTWLNDGYKMIKAGGLPHSEIAKFIRENKTAVFKEN